MKLIGSESFKHSFEKLAMAQLKCALDLRAVGWLVYKFNGLQVFYRQINGSKFHFTSQP